MGVCLIIEMDTHKYTDTYTDWYLLIKKKYPVYLFFSLTSSTYSV